MENYKERSKKLCAQCGHYDYCDRASRCDGDCGRCDDDTCENNPIYKLKTRKEDN